MRNLPLVAGIALGALVVFAFRLVLLALGSVVYLYLLPGIVARNRHHPRQGDLFKLSAFGGWLVLPWLVALVAALSGPATDALYADGALVAGALDE